MTISFKTITDEKKLREIFLMLKLLKYKDVFNGTEHEFILWHNDRMRFCVSINIDKETAGYFWLDMCGRDVAYIHHCVLPKFYQYSLLMGKEVIKFCFDKLGLRILRGETKKTNILAVRFLKKLGFSVISEVSSYYEDGSDMIISIKFKE